MDDPYRKNQIAFPQSREPVQLVHLIAPCSRQASGKYRPASFGMTDA